MVNEWWKKVKTLPFYHEIKASYEESYNLVKNKFDLQD